MKSKLGLFLFLIVGLLFSSQGIAQHKQLWAASYLNKKAPELQLETWLSEKPKMEGKFILLDFWATWCGPCKKGIPHMNALSQKFEDNMVVIAISKESEAKVKKMNYPVIEYYSAMDVSGKLNSVYGIKGIPHAVLIDPDGFVRWEGFPTLSGHKLTSSVIEDIIDTYKKQ